MPDDVPRQYIRRIIRITAEQSPNVLLARAEAKAGLAPSRRVIVPGVLPWDDYVKRRATWDKVRQCVSLDAQFWEGADALLYPPDWLNRAESLHLRVQQILVDRRTGRVLPRYAEGVGIDTAEGGDDTCMAATDRYGLIELDVASTPNTGVIQGAAIAFIQRHANPLAERIWAASQPRSGLPARLLSYHTCFDRGGGGKQIADAINRDMERFGWRARSVGFGEAVAPDPRRGTKSTTQQVEVRDERYTYKNRRAELYGTLRECLDPTLPHPSFPDGFSLPPASEGEQYAELRRQLAPIPRTMDAEGRLYLLPKDKPTATYTGPTLKSLLGCSPDEADAVTLSIHGMLTRGTLSSAGAYSPSAEVGPVDEYGAGGDQDPSMHGDEYDWETA